MVSDHVSIKSVLNLEEKMFDFDLTSPLMAGQFLLLVILLNVIFYKPLTKVLEDRNDYILTKEQDGRERLAKAEALAQQYEQQLAGARKQSVEVIANAQAEAKKIADEQIAAAQKEAIAQREQATKEIEGQKQAAMRALEQQVETLSSQILAKLGLVT